MSKVICFHKPKEAYGFLSNWYLSEFTAEGRRFTSMEQYMMYKKAQTFRDQEAAEKILEISDVSRIKQLGRQVRNYEEFMWEGRRQLIVYRGLLEKFGQNETLKKRLKNTGESLLAECAVQDKIWGIGLSMQDGRRLTPSLWRGRNLLGFALMEVREQLK